MARLTTSVIAKIVIDNISRLHNQPPPMAWMNG